MDSESKIKGEMMQKRKIRDGIKINDSNANDNGRTDHTSFNKEICYLKKHLNGIEKELDGILKGKILSHRHELFKEGLKSRGVLLEMVIYGPFGNYLDEIHKFISNRYDNNANAAEIFLQMESEREVSLSVSKRFHLENEQDLQFENDVVLNAEFIQPNLTDIQCVHENRKVTDKPVFKIPLREIVVAGKNKCVEEKEDSTHHRHDSDDPMNNSDDLFVSSSDGSDAENNTEPTGHLIFKKEHGQQLESIFPDMVTGKQSIVKRIVLETVKEKCPELLKNYTETQVLSQIRTQKRAYDRRMINKELKE